ncbi:MAG: DUF1223 domain-containing protein, partial [Xanthobacteraceae bacterium]
MTSRQIKPLYAAAFALVSCAFGAASPAAATETRAVIELFTSQGCDSCPPADKLFGELSQQPDIIA